MSEMVGRTIADRYRVDAFVGRGGMADVYKVWDSQRLAYLALKQLHADLAEDIAFLRRFRREARTLEALAHPNIVRFYGLEQVDGMALMIMDFVEGVHLRKAIFENHAALPLEQVLGIMRPVTAALHYAHGQGIAHCDMKPANVMIKQNGDVFVADFGIARLAESATTTMAGAGTPAYMAPEQCRAEAVDGRTDIYAMGILLYEMLTGGERPFVGEHATGTGSTSEKVRWEQLNAPPPSPREFNPSLPPAIEQVIFKCLEKDPGSRYQSTPDLWNALVTATANIHGDAYSVPTIKVPPLGSTLPPLVTPTPTPPSYYTPPPPVFASPPAPAATVLESAPVAAAPRRSLAGLWITLALIAMLAVGGLIAMQIGGFGLALFKPTDTPTPTVTPTLTPTPSPTFEPPAVQLISPTGDQVNLVLGKEPLVVQVVAMAGAGVARVDFTVNGALKDARQGDGVDKSMATQFEWIPPDEGVYLISVEVLGRDGSASEMTAFSVIVSRPTPTPTPRPLNTPAPSATASATGRASTGGGTSGGSSGGTSTGARSVDGTFTSSATNVSAGQQVTISWDLTANQAFIFSAELWERALPAGFQETTLATNVKQSSGSRAFAPMTTTTYELHIFYNDKNEQATQQTKTVTVTIGGAGAIAPAATTAPAPGGSGGGPITVRRVTFVSAQRIGTGNDGNLTLSVEFTGGSGPFTISGDGVTPVTKGITGTYTDAGVTYSYVHFVKVASCGGNFAATMRIADAVGQTASFPYYIGTVTCP